MNRAQFMMKHLIYQINNVLSFFFAKLGKKKGRPVTIGVLMRCTTHAVLNAELLDAKRG